MFAATDTDWAPWFVAKSDDKKRARLNIIAHLIVINFRQEAAQARVHLPWDELGGRSWRLNDVLSGESYDRSGDEMRDSGLYVELKPWEYNFFQVQAL